MKATRLRRSVARRLDCGWARASRLALDVVMEGSVADARSSLGRLPLELLVDESLLCIWREFAISDAIADEVCEERTSVSRFYTVPQPKVNND